MKNLVSHHILSYDSSIDCTNHYDLKSKSFFGFEETDTSKTGLILYRDYSSNEQYPTLS